MLMVTSFLMLSHSVLIYKKELELTPGRAVKDLVTLKGPSQSPGTHSTFSASVNLGLPHGVGGRLQRPHLEPFRYLHNPTFSQHPGLVGFKRYRSVP